MARDIERDLRQALRGFEEIVDLHPREAGERVERVPVINRDDVIRLRVESEFGGEEILQEICVAEFRDVGEAGPFLAEDGAVRERQAIAIRVDRVSRKRSAVQ